MVELRILSGRQAGSVVEVGRLPFRIGRAADQDLSASEPGLWDRHARIDQAAGGSFRVVAEGQATITVDEKRVDEHFLRNGQIFDCGALKVQFQISPARQRPLKWAPRFFWLLLLGVAAFEAVLLVRFSR